MNTPQIIFLGLAGSFAAGAMTALGAVPVLFNRVMSLRAYDAFLGFAAGVMLAASFFSLIIPGLEEAEALSGSVSLSALIIVAGLVLGVGTVAALNEWIPHAHFVQGRQGPMSPRLQKIWLFVLAITIHNFPEGLAVGVSFGGGDIGNGTSIAVGIGLQNAPEGLAVGVALLSEGYSRKVSFLIAALSGMIEPVGGLLGVAAVTGSHQLLPWGLAFAAGAMIYVIVHEIIPEIHSRAFANEATAGLTAGLVVMMFLDVTFG
ncbi:MAG: ZIP family metal transporter [Hyphomicrobiales bacterium]|nr:ZIP family metal transporter [Hyphomicrobiales bacterium]